MLRVLATLALIALAGPVYAQGSAVLSCTPPTKYTDGTTIASLASYKWYWGTAQGNYPNSKITPSSGGCGTTISPLTPGPWFFVVTAIDTTGTESVVSNVATKTIAPPKPNPPTNLTVAADLTAWVLAPSTNRVALVAVGKFTAGTTCDPSQPVLDKFVVIVDSAHPIQFPPGKTSGAVTYLGSCS